MPVYAYGREVLVRIRTARDLGAIVREQRKRRKWSQDRLAEEIGVSRTWISEFENGKATAEIGLALKALRVMGVTLSALEPAGGAVQSSAIRTTTASEHAARTSSVRGVPTSSPRLRAGANKRSPGKSPQASHSPPPASAERGPALTIRGRPIGGRRGDGE